MTAGEGWSGLMHNGDPADAPNLTAALMGRVGGGVNTALLLEC